MLQELHVLALFVVQLVPVTAIPFEHVQIFCVHLRLDAEEQAVVSRVPTSQADRHPVQALPFL